MINYHDNDTFAIYRPALTLRHITSCVKPSVFFFYIYASKPVPAGSEAEHSQKKKQENEQITCFFIGNEYWSGAALISGVSLAHLLSVR